MGLTQPNQCVQPVCRCKHRRHRRQKHHLPPPSLASCRGPSLQFFEESLLTLLTLLWASYFSPQSHLLAKTQVGTPTPLWPSPFMGQTIAGPWGSWVTVILAMVERILWAGGNRGAGRRPQSDLWYKIRMVCQTFRQNKGALNVQYCEKIFVNCVPAAKKKSLCCVVLIRETAVGYRGEGGGGHGSGGVGEHKGATLQLR